MKALTQDDLEIFSLYVAKLIYAHSSQARFKEGRIPTGNNVHVRFYHVNKQACFM